MNATTVSLRPAAGDLQYVETLLERNDLPAADVRAKPDCFYVAESDGEPVGVGGLEVHGTDALLRSVAVEESVRGEGFGTAICDALEAEAGRLDVTALYLLTTTAAPLFETRDYERIDREDAPETIRGTTEFEEYCPESAVCLRKSL